MSRLLCLFVAVTVQASSLAAEPSASPSPERKVLVLHSPAPKVPPEARAKRLAGKGVCVLHVRPDGTVSRVEMSKSTGQPLLDKACIDAFSRWQFKPGTMTKVNIPITFTGNYTKPPKT